MVLEGMGTKLTDVINADQLDPSMISKSLDSLGHHVRVEDGEDNFMGRIEEADAVLTQISKVFMCAANAICPSTRHHDYVLCLVIKTTTNNVQISKTGSD
jgi:hypothetical protein